jgi:origin recognition complex subunit 2
MPALRRRANGGGGGDGDGTKRNANGLAFAAPTRGIRVARGGTRRVRGHKPVAKEYLDARNAERAASKSGKETSTSGRGGYDAADVAAADSLLDDYVEDATALAVREALEAAEREEDYESDEFDENGNKKRRRKTKNKGIGYIASKGRGTAVRKGQANMLGLLDLADEETIRELLGHIKVGHDNERAAIVVQLEKQYRRWFQLLRAGFNVLLYGFGSKKALLEDFEKRFCVDGGVIVVNGFFPSLKPKQVVVAAAAALAGKDAANTSAKSETSSMESLLAQIESATRGSATREPKRLYIILHNIDGTQLRTSEAQALLGELASMDRVYLIASIDHVNAPLLWSKREAARFNWVWQEAATFAPYALETANLPQLLASKGEERHVRGAANVLRSLTSNGRAIFRLLAEHQLENQDSQGMPLDMFYAACREQFLVSSEVTLRVHLTEFTDHELVRSKRGADGRDLLSVPLNADALKELLSSFD